MTIIDLIKREKHVVTGAIAFLTSCFLLQYSSHVFSSFIDVGAVFTRTSPTHWETHFTPKTDGNYYISAGRPRAPCKLSVNGKAVATTQTGIPEIRSALLVGAPFSANAGSENDIQLNCELQGGFAGDLTHDIIIAPHRSGQILQLWRGLTELVMGPISSLILLIFTMMQINRYSRSRSDTLRGSEIKTQFKFLQLAMIALIYSLSLSYYTRLFMDGYTASFLHITLRHFFALSTVIFLTSNPQVIRLATITYFIFILTTLVLGFSGSENLTVVYRFQYPIYALITAVITFQLLSERRFSKSLLMRQQLAVSWTLIQLIDSSTLFIGLGAYTAPSVVVLLTLGALAVHTEERKIVEIVEVASSRILLAIQANRPLSEILTQLASITAGETHFKRVSAYIDSFCVGAASEPRQAFLRVMESGYQKDTTQDKHIHIKNGQGKLMASATLTGEISLIQNSKDKSWFAVVPIGKHACINLSDDRPVSLYNVYESEEILKRIVPSLNALNTKILSQGFRQGFALEKLRSIFGDGRFEVETGAIFIDINNYSTLTEKHGTVFAEFINTTYFPALIKTVANLAVPEAMRGDEIYFVCMKELLEKGSSVDRATLEAITEMQKFIYGSGAALCRENGFEPLTSSIGATVGVNTLVCDNIQVRTAGSNINDAKRLQEVATKGSCLVKIETAHSHSDLGHFGEDFPILVKKNFIMAKKFYWNTNKKSAA